ncbi:15170_t:CDS:2, partial [Acaulospora colombiana]
FAILREIRIEELELNETIERIGAETVEIAESLKIGYFRYMFQKEPYYYEEITKDYRRHKEMVRDLKKHKLRLENETGRKYRASEIDDTEFREKLNKLTASPILMRLCEWLESLEEDPVIFRPYKNLEHVLGDRPTLFYYLHAKTLDERVGINLNNIRKHILHDRDKIFQDLLEIISRKFDISYVQTIQDNATAPINSNREETRDHKEKEKYSDWCNSILERWSAGLLDETVERKQTRENDDHDANDEYVAPSSEALQVFDNIQINFNMLVGLFTVKNYFQKDSSVL